MASYCYFFSYQNSFLILLSLSATIPSLSPLVNELLDEIYWTDISCSSVLISSSVNYNQTSALAHYIKTSLITSPMSFKLLNQMVSSHTCSQSVAFSRVEHFCLCDTLLSFDYKEIWFYCFTRSFFSISFAIYLLLPDLFLSCSSKLSSFTFSYLYP